MQGSLNEDQTNHLEVPTSTNNNNVDIPKQSSPIFCLQCNAPQPKLHTYSNQW